MAQIQENLAAPLVPDGGIPTYPQGIAPDPNRGAPRLYTDSLTKLSAEAVYYEKWQSNSGAAIKQTGYKNLLDGPSSVGNVTE